jgi:protein-S-isoprenylcysteine O-methyltransferase Ste14
MNKLNYLGIGPKIGGVTIPLLAITIFISLKYKQLFSIYSGESRLMMYLGILLVISGLILYFSTLPLLLKGLKETKLITTGAYALCRNPLYAAFILFLLPGIGLIMNSWIVLSICFLAYLLFKINIRSEYLEMKNIFGDEYKKYSEATPELFPLSLKKMLRRRKSSFGFMSDKS